MRFLSVGLFAISSILASSVDSNAQTSVVANGGTQWNLPASLVEKQLPDGLVQQTKGDIDAIFVTATGDATKLTSITQGTVLSLPSSLSKVVDRAVHESSTESAAAMGLGLCMATSSLMDAANDPATIPAQSQSARDLARAILTSVAAASQASTTGTGSISNSFGISVNSSGTTTIACKSIGGQVVATAAVSGATGSSGAGVGSATVSSGDGTFLAQGSEETSGGGGSVNGVAFPSAAGARSFTANTTGSTGNLNSVARTGAGALTTVPLSSLGSAGRPTVAVPGPDAGAGLSSLVVLGGLWLARNGRVKSVAAKLRMYRRGIMNGLAGV